MFFLRQKIFPLKQIKNHYKKISVLDPQNTLSNINNWTYWLKYDGQSANNPYNGSSGAVYPRGTAGAVYVDGVVWGAQVNGEVRVGGQTYLVGTQPLLGHIYRIRKDWAVLTTADVLQETAEFYNISVSSVTEQQANEIIDQYKSD